MSIGSDPAGTADKPSKNHSTPLAEYTSSSPTITGTLAPSFAIKDSMDKAMSKIKKVEKSLDKLQAEWDKMKKSKK